MTHSVPPMLPEDRKHLDVAPIPELVTRLQRYGIVWVLTGEDIVRGKLTLPRLTLTFAALNPVNPVNPV